MPINSNDNWVKIIQEEDRNKRNISRIKRIQSGVNQIGWVADPYTWVYVSATSFKIVGVDLRTQFPFGTKIKVTQGEGSVKYLVVTSTAYGTDTTIAVTGGNDYSLTNEAIVNPFYSYVVCPQGFPGWFSWTPTFVSSGASFSYTTQYGEFVLQGKVVSFQGLIALNGAPSGTTSNQLYFKLPLTATSQNPYTQYFANYWSIVTLGANMTQLLTYAGSNSQDAFMDATGSGQTRVHLTAAALGANAVVGISGQFLI